MGLHLQSSPIGGDNGVIFFQQTTQKGTKKVLSVSHHDFNADFCVLVV